MSAVSTSTSPTPADLAMRRRALGISQAHLAELIRTGRMNVSRMERGYPMPPERREAANKALNFLEISFQLAAEVARKAGAQNAG